MGRFGYTQLNFPPNQIFPIEFSELPRVTLIIDYLK